MAQARQPWATIAARCRCSAIAPGVVSSAGRGPSGPPSSTATVPSSPQRVPAWFSSCWVRVATVVLPLVPVTPTRCSRAAGSPNNAAAARAARAWSTRGATSSATARGGSTGSGTRTAVAPASIAWATRARQRSSPVPRATNSTPAAGSAPASSRCRSGATSRPSSVSSPIRTPSRPGGGVRPRVRASS